MDKEAEMREKMCDEEVRSGEAERWGEETRKK